MQRLCHVSGAARRAGQHDTSNAVQLDTSDAGPTAATGADAVPAAATAPPAAAAPVDTHIRVYGNCTSPAVDPAEIVLACADYGALLEGLRWTNWTAASATAVGTFEYNDCTPSCVEGHHHAVPGTRLTLTVPPGRRVARGEPHDRRARLLRRDSAASERPRSGSSVRDAPAQPPT
jgi:hypothetical protein